MKLSLLLYSMMLAVTIACSDTEHLAAGSSIATESSVDASNIKLPPRDSKMEVAEQPRSANVQKIIREANLQFKSDDMSQTYNTISASVKKHGGIVHSDSESKDSESLHRRITVRLPSQGFESFIADISHDIEYFDRKEITAEDVTTQYIDLEARLKAKKILESRYLALLQKAGKVSEMLEIEKQLSSIREEIESHEGQLRYLQNRVSLSTVNIEFYKRMAFGGGVTVSYGEKMWNAIKSGFNGISAFFLGILYIWPFILILAGLIFILRKKFMKKPI